MQTLKSMFLCYFYEKGNHCDYLIFRDDYAQTTIMEWLKSQPTRYSETIYLVVQRWLCVILMIPRI